MTITTLSTQETLKNETLKDKILAYEQTPKEIMEILRLFSHNDLSYILFKCEHIFQGVDKNLDILFESTEDYKKAAELLKTKDFILRLSEKVEKYKEMYCGLIGRKVISIHLHREIAWHGIKALDKSYVFRKKQIINPIIIIPSLEDSILIHTAHILFENYKITDKERFFLNKADEPSINRKYIDMQLKKNKWKQGFNKIIDYNKNNTQPAIKDIILPTLNKVSREPKTSTYLISKIAKKILRKISMKRKGYLISFIGMNGTGKSTITRRLLNEFEPITKHLGIKQEYHYMGWKPTFFLTKIISNRFKKKDKKIFNEMVFKKQVKRFDLKQELLFLYQFIEFYYRHLTEIRPKLRENSLVVTDRYFYDIFGQYPYACNSIILKFLFRIYPRPDFVFLLDAETEELQRRGKTNKDNLSQIEPIQRKIMPIEYLNQQRQNYWFLRDYLKNYLKVEIVDAEENIDSNCKKIKLATWKRLIK